MLNLSKMDRVHDFNFGHAGVKMRSNSGEHHNLANVCL